MANIAESRNGSVLVVHKMTNGMVVPSKATDVTIWGGESLNCGESTVSNLVRRQQEHLIKFVFLPQRTKGGRMVRPYYYRSDRSTKMTFPALRTIGYYQDMGTPSDALWIVPNLETLYVFQGTGYRNSPLRILDRWAVETDLQLPQRVLKESPNLKDIICATPDFSAPFKYHTLRRLVPPDPIPAQCLRVLDIATNIESTETCPMAKLPAAVMNRIVDFCHLVNWKTIDYYYDEEA